ncbi:MAG: hypothetical protein LBU39_09990 [Desulfobulbaceae bacterium]|jgi:hypothetical protein|nr:hypothetical protein [Desulfobulbaceae bacterium]
MNNDIDFEEILAQYRAQPYELVPIQAVHTGEVHFLARQDDEAAPASGEWLQIPGTALYEIVREKNTKRVAATTNGQVSMIRHELEGRFVEAGETLMEIRHPLKKKEIIEAILREVLLLFPAPETAKYFFAIDVQSCIDKKGARSVTVDPGDEILTMSLMKRDTPLYYHGERGVLYSIYFTPGLSVARGEPLIGVCPPEKLPLIQKIITRVKAEWDAAGRA